MIQSQSMDLQDESTALRFPYMIPATWSIQLLLDYVYAVVLVFEVHEEAA
jgi:hypothetical protein